MHYTRISSSVSKSCRAFVCLSLITAFVASTPVLISAQNVRSGAAGKRSTPSKARSNKLPIRESLTKDDQIVGVPYKGDPGIVESVAKIMKRERATPKKPFDPNYVEEGAEHEEYRPKKSAFPGSPDVSRFPYEAGSADFLVRDFLAPQTPSTTIAGPGRTSDSTSSVPPDSVGGVGPTQVLMHANGRIKVYNKLTGALGGLDASDQTFWTSVRNGSGVSDPRVEFDSLSGRWFVVMINVASTQNRIMIAVSSGPVITDSSSFTFFQITTASGFLDYPTLGVDANALYIGGNAFTSATGSFSETRGYVVKKADLLTGTLTATVFNGLATTGVGPYTPQGVSNDDPGATEGYFIGVDNASFSLLQIRRVSNPGGTPTISGNITLTVPTTTFPTGQDHQGRVTTGFTRFLDPLDDRLFQAQIHRNQITGVSTLWTAHNIQVNASGVGSTAAGSRNGTRWYQIGNMTTTPTLIQSGTLYDNAASNPNGYWIPSIAMSGQGHAAVGASSAGFSRFAELWSAGRLRTDALGLTQSPVQIQSSSTAYNLQSTATQRWGDYSKTSVDPCDNQSMWHFGEYADAANSWRMRAVKLQAPAPPASVSPLPASLPEGAASVNVIVTGVSIAGTEFFDNPAGFACSASCSSTGTGTCHMSAAVTGFSPLASMLEGRSTTVPTAALSINSVTFDNPTQVTLNVNTFDVTAGSYTIRLTNPDGQFTTFAVQVLQPTAANVSLAGRVTTSAGIGLRGATVTITDARGNTRMTTTSSFGYYRFDDVESGQTYLVNANLRRYTFESRSVMVGDDLSNVDFVAVP